MALGRRPTTESRRLSAKQRGETAELAFLYRAAALGLGVLKPLGDSLPYDVAVDNGRRLLRVQVKSASRAHRGVYEINAGRGRNVKRPYTARDIDFLAACIFADDRPHRRGRRERGKNLELSSRAPARDLGFVFSNDPMTRSPDDPMSWFIFPVSAFSPRKTIRLSPRRPARWLPYREAWHLLLAKPTTKDTKDHEGHRQCQPARTACANGGHPARARIKKEGREPAPPPPRGPCRLRQQAAGPFRKVFPHCYRTIKKAIKLRS